MTDENEEDDDSDEAYDANNNYQSRVARAFAPYSDMVLEQVGMGSGTECAQQQDCPMVRVVTSV